MLCWLITICTIARLWIVIRDSFECCERGRKWVWPTRLAIANENENEGRGGSESERLVLIRDSRTRTRDGGGSESERLVLIRDSRTRTRGGGRKWVWTTRSHSRFANENEGRREEVSLNDSLNHSPETRTNERTNERLSLANWTTRTDSRKRIMKSITSVHCFLISRATEWPEVHMSQR